MALAGRERLDSLRQLLVCDLGLTAKGEKIYCRIAAGLQVLCALLFTYRGNIQVTRGCHPLCWDIAKSKVLTMFLLSALQTRADRICLVHPGNKKTGFLK